MYEERLQPHDIEAEEAVIGSLLIDGEAILKVAGRLNPGTSTGTGTPTATRLALPSSNAVRR